MIAQANSTAPASPDASELSLGRLLHLVARRRLLVGAAMAVVLALAAAYLLWQQPQFRSHAALRLEDGRSGQSILSMVSPLGGGAKQGIATEILELQSYRMAAEVVDSLALHVRVLARNAPRSEVLTRVSAPRRAAPGVYLLERDGDGTYTIRADGKRTAPGVALPPRVVPGQPFRIGTVELELRASAEAPERIRIEVVPFHRAVLGLQRRLSIYRPHPDAQIVHVEHASTDPWLAAAVPNVLASHFIRYKTALSRSEGQSTVQFLNDQLTVYERELADAEDALKAFRERSQVVSPEEQAKEHVRQFAALQAERDQLFSERESLGRLLARAEAASNQGASGAAYRQLVAHPAFLMNPAVKDILNSLNALEDERTKLLARRMDTNQDVQLLSQRIDVLERELHNLAVNYMAALESRITGVDASLDRFAGTMEEIPAREIEYARLLRQAKVSEEIYTLVQTRLKESEIQQAAEPGNVRVVDAALVPDRPFAPRPVRLLGVAGLLGLLLGVAGAVVRESMDTKVHTRADAQSAAGGLPVLGHIPPIRAVAANGTGLRGRRSALSGSDAMLQRLVARHAPRSPESEAYRSLRTSITFANFEHPPQTLVVASATPGDGKSTSAANLAITIAQQGSRTLLVDADLRKGLLHQVFGVGQEPGLTHLLMGRAALADVTHPVSLNGDGESVLHVLTTGALPPNPAEMLGSQRMRTLLQEMRQVYDVVIFDAPPLNLVTDAAVLGTMVDGTLLVARAGVTERAALHHAAALLRHVHAPVVGIVLNDFDAGGGYYAYGYSS